MKMSSRIIGVAGFCAIATIALAAVWSSTAQFGSTTLNGYNLNNDVWGSGAGPQTIWANSGTNWGVWSNQPNTGGVKSYPHHGRTVNKSLNSLNSLSGTVSLTTPSGGAWEAAYDLWDTSNHDETMIWLNYTGTATGGGNVKPISFNYDSNGNAIPVLTNQSIGGATWNVFRGNFGTNCTSFLRTSKTNNTTVNILALLKFAESRGYIGNQTVGSQQFGFEITSSSGGLNYQANNSTITWN